MSADAAGTSARATPRPAQLLAGMRLRSEAKDVLLPGA
jgi:hypothetical protein